MKTFDLMRLAANQGVNRLKTDLAYKRGWNLTVPHAVSYAITHLCNLRCSTCSYWKVKDRTGELSTDEVVSMIDRLRAWLGPFPLNIGGGEPMVRRDLFDIVRHARRRGCYTGVVTNGYTLDDEHVDAIVSSGLHQLAISINSTNENVHDRSRGREGSLRRIQEGIERLRSKGGGPRIKILSILMEENLDDLEDLVRYVQEHDLASIAFQPLNYVTGIHAYERGWYQQDTSWPRDPDRAVRAMTRLAELKRLGAPIENTLEQLTYFAMYFRAPEDPLPIDCKVGVTSFDVDPFGKVRLCYTMEPIGDLRTADPRAIWRGAQAKGRRAEIRSCEQNCRLKNCNFTKPIRHFLPMFVNQLTMPWRAGQRASVPAEVPCTRSSS